MPSPPHWSVDDWYGTVEVRVDDLKNRLNVMEQRLAELRDEVSRLWEGPDTAVAAQMTCLESALEEAAAAADLRSAGDKRR